MYTQTIQVQILVQANLGDYFLININKMERQLVPPRLVYDMKKGPA
jgi:hypothetical protein